MKYLHKLAWGLTALMWFAPSLAVTASDIWILVDTRADTLVVMRGDHPVKTFSNIALGRGGTSLERRRGDGKTPLGIFRIGWVNWNSPFHIFIGLDFPSWAHALRAHQHKIIDDRTYDAIMNALASGQIPPQDTVLGGNIGIHGLGKADPTVHKVFNWTKGCIALTNEQIEELADWVRPGIQVIIK